MRKGALRFLIIVTLIATLAILLVAATMADGGGTPESPQQEEFVEWDGTVLTVRQVPVGSEAEREFLIEHSRKNRMLLDAAMDYSQRYQDGGSPAHEVIETEYGTVTTERTITEGNQSSATPAEVSVEVEHIETPHGLITIETQSFGEHDEEAAARSGGQPLGLSEYTDGLFASCGSNGVEFNFGSNQTQPSYVLNWSGGSFADYVVCPSSSCSFKISTSWSAYYTTGRAFTTSPGYVHGFGFDDYRCH